MTAEEQKPDCFRYSNIKIIKGRAYCTFPDVKCSYQDRSDTQPCEMYSSLTGVSEEQLPLCTYPNIADRVKHALKSHLHEMEVRKKMMR